MKDIVYDLRNMTNNSTLSRYLEQAVTRYLAWLERQAPGAWEAMKAFRTPQKEQDGMGPAIISGGTC